MEEKMIKLKIDEHTVEVELDKGLTLIEVIDDMYYQLKSNPRFSEDLVPRLCHQEGLKAYGSCKVCVVEVEKPEQEAKVRTSCNYKLTEKDEGLIVRTITDDVIESRKGSLAALLEKAPGSEELKNLAFKLGVETKPIDSDDKNYMDKCIDCFLCERVCRDFVGPNAIKVEGKGKDRHMEGATDDCVGCGSCAYHCPTGAIDIEEYKKEVDGVEKLFRKIHGKEFELVLDGNTKLTTAQIEYAKNHEGKTTPYEVIVNEALCKGCHNCNTDCPQGQFYVDNEHFNDRGYRPPQWKSDLNEAAKNLNCTGCGACYDSCPEAGIDIKVKRKGIVRIIEND